MTFIIIYDNILFIRNLFEGVSNFIKVRLMDANLRPAVTTVQRKIKKNTELGPRYEIVDLLRTARKAQDITQEDLAARVGTKKSNISRFESGRYNPSLDFLIKVANSLGMQLQITLK